MAAKPKKLDAIKAGTATSAATLRPGDTLTPAQWAQQLLGSRNGLAFLLVAALGLGGFIASLLLGGTTPNSTAAQGPSAPSESVAPPTDPTSDPNRAKLLNQMFAEADSANPAIKEAKELLKNTALQPMAEPDAAAAGNANQPDPFEVQNVVVGEPAVYLPPGADAKDATVSVTVKGVIKNKSGRDCRRIGIKAYCMNDFGQVVGQGGTIVADLAATNRNGVAFTLTISGMPKSAVISRVEVVPTNPYWAIKY